MKPVIAAVLLTLACAAVGEAQQPMSASAQIAAAIAPLPEEFRETATVMGYRPGKAGLAQLRAGTGSFICLADDPSDQRFHVACYHKSLEQFMARGRELRANGVTGSAVDSARYAEIESGKLAMPRHPAALYSLTLRPDQVDAQSGAVPATAKPLYVVYIAYATAESSGLPKTAAPGMPWIMFPGTPKAHIMFVPAM
ncbi:MAG TPA: hypothetical protein VFZ04_13645 [Longimicrobiales bacterium]